MNKSPATSLKGKVWNIFSVQFGEMKNNDAKMRNRRAEYRQLDTAHQ